MKDKKFTHKIMKSSTYSYSITLPKEIMEKYGWNEHQKLIIRDKGRGKIEIGDWRKK